MATYVTLSIKLSDSANWIAQDADGDWYEYKLKPNSYRNEVAWEPNEFDDDYRTVAKGTPNKEWKDTLQEV